MLNFSGYLTEDKGGKNLHLEHIEDEILNFGVPGGRAAINFVRSYISHMPIIYPPKPKKAKWPKLNIPQYPQTKSIAIASKQKHKVFPSTFIKEVEIKPQPNASLPIVINAVMKERIKKKINTLGLLIKNFTRTLFIFNLQLPGP